MGGLNRRMKNRDDYTTARAIARSMHDVDLDDYLRDVSRYPLLSVAEERAVCRAMRHGTKKQRMIARERIVNGNLRLVISIVKQYTKRTKIPFIDLVQEGNKGLMRAADKFDYERGFRFSTYATGWVKQFIRRAVLCKGRLVRIPEYAEQILRMIYAAESEMSRHLGRVPTPAELYGELHAEVRRLRCYDVTREYFYELVEIAHKYATWGLASIERFTQSGIDGEEVHSFITRDLTAHEAASMEERRQTIKDALADLPPRTRTILECRYGLVEEGKTMTLVEVGKMLGITRERVRQIEVKALERLRDCRPLQMLSFE